MDAIESDIARPEPSESMLTEARTRFEILNAVTAHRSLRPLAGHVFRVLWIATVASNLGTWMQDVGESWLKWRSEQCQRSRTSQKQTGA